MFPETLRLQETVCVGLETIVSWVDLEIERRQVNAGGGDVSK